MSTKISCDNNGNLNIISNGNGGIINNGKVVPVGSAPPQFLIGATSIFGTATTYMTSDSVPALEQTGVTAGTYTSPSITVDATGRILGASNNKLSYCNISFTSSSTIDIQIISTNVYQDILTNPPTNLFLNSFMSSDFIINNQTNGEIKYIGLYNLTININSICNLINANLNTISQIGFCLFYNLNGNSGYSKIINSETFGYNSTLISTNLSNQTIINITPNTLIKMQIQNISNTNNIKIFFASLQITNLGYSN